MNMSTQCSLRYRNVWTLAALAAILITGPRLAAQEDRTFVEEKRITAIDLVLGFETGAFREWAADHPVPKVQPQDFEILYDGQPRPVVTTGPAVGPWQIVVYFDAALTSSAGLRWAAATLAGRSDELTALGEVAIVVADPAPWTMLSPTRDRDQLNASLSQLARFQEGRDELMTLRAQAVEELSSPAPEAELGSEVLAAVAAEEARIVGARHDDLLLELAERRGAGPYRALLIASGGYDLDPGKFYRSLAGDQAAPAAGTPAAGKSSATPTGDLTAATETLARTLAAYGWIVLPLLPPEGDPLQEGVRIGKLRLTGPSVEVERQRPTPTDWEEYDRTVIRLAGARFEGKRRPKRAEAYLELGTALHDQGKLAEAEDALRQAIYHFAGDPKTAGRQAAAFARLGAVLAAREEAQEANAAFRLARRLDPGVEIAGIGPIAALLAPEAPLETLARTTAGGLVQNPKELARALESLRRRVWLSYQVAGPADGELHALEARYQPSQRRLSYPGWARSSTSESLSAARARRLLGGEPTGGTLAFRADFHRHGEIHLEVEPASTAQADEAAEAATQTLLRLTLGVGGPDVEPAVEHRRLGSQTGQETWSYRVGFEMPEDRSWLAVLVEDLETGAWGGQLIEVP